MMSASTVLVISCDDGNGDCPEVWSGGTDTPASLVCSESSAAGWLWTNDLPGAHYCPEHSRARSVSSGVDSTTSQEEK